MGNPVTWPPLSPPLVVWLVSHSERLDRRETENFYFCFSFVISLQRYAVLGETTNKRPLLVARVLSDIDGIINWQSEMRSIADHNSPEGLKQHKFKEVQNQNQKYYISPEGDSVWNMAPVNWVNWRLMYTVQIVEASNTKSTTSINMDAIECGISFQCCANTDCVLLSYYKLIFWIVRGKSQKLQTFTLFILSYCNTFSTRY